MIWHYVCTELSEFSVHPDVKCIKWRWMHCSNNISKQRCLYAECKSLTCCSPKVCVFTVHVFGWSLWASWAYPEWPPHLYLHSFLVVTGKTCKREPCSFHIQLSSAESLIWSAHCTRCRPLTGIHTILRTYGDTPFRNRWLSMELMKNNWYEVKTPFTLEVAICCRPVSPGQHSGLMHSTTWT